MNKESNNTHYLKQGIQNIKHLLYKMQQIYLAIYNKIKCSKANLSYNCIHIYICLASVFWPV